MNWGHFLLERSPKSEMVSLASNSSTQERAKRRSWVPRSSWTTYKLMTNRSCIVSSLSHKARAGDVVEWQSTCLARVRPGVPSPALKIRTKYNKEQFHCYLQVAVVVVIVMFQNIWSLFIGQVLHSNSWYHQRKKKMTKTQNKKLYFLKSTQQYLYPFKHPEARVKAMAVIPFWREISHLNQRPAVLPRLSSCIQICSTLFRSMSSLTSAQITPGI